MVTVRTRFRLCRDFMHVGDKAVLSSPDIGKVLDLQIRLQLQPPVAVTAPARPSSPFSGFPFSNSWELKCAAPSAFSDRVTGSAG